MADNRPLKHIKIDGASSSEEFVSPRRGSSPPIKQRNRKRHGNKILDRLNKIREEFESLKEKELPEGIVQDNAIYVEFISDYDVEPAFDSFHDDRSSKFQLINIKKESIKENDKEKVRYRVNVMLTEGGISHFINKVKEYLSENTKYKGEDTGNPQNRRLINNINIIQQAALEAFWSEPKEVPFPDKDEEVWWEVWFRRKREADNDQERERIINQLNLVDAEISEQELVFPEHYIRLVKATSVQLSNSLILLDSLAELRKPKETADFFTGLTITEKEDSIQELKDRIEKKSNENSIAVCLLDSGVQNKHPLLKGFLTDENMHTYKPEWGTYDGANNGGHGTCMAGLSLYGDLTEALTSTSNIQLYHQLESVKIINHQDPHDPDLYGAVTEESVSSPIASFPDRARVYCMAVTDKDQAFHGRPSSWSAAVDKITFGGREENNKQLLLISGGNVFIEKPEDYPDLNYYDSVHDPGQSFNAITVGSYTEMDTVDGETKHLAEKGGMAPSNSTSVMWENEWAIKPDIVLEGGNYGVERGDLVKPHSLQLLTTSSDYRVNYFKTFCDTSASTALAARMAAQIKFEYPDLWQETIRGLMIHSAEWTQAMLKDEKFKELERVKKRGILRSFGYGVPNLQKALHSANNSLTLIAEEEIQPYQKEGLIKYNEIHYYQLPWPKEVLEKELSETDVKLNITLSYFIEPNPGDRIYANKFSYQSHGLRFNVIRPGEDFETFRKRVNGKIREEGERGFSGEDWVIGSQHRDKGSIHRDMWEGSGADLSTRNTIAVYPVYGWYQKRSKLVRFNDFVRYSLIISIETPKMETDIYTPVKNLIEIET